MQNDTLLKKVDSYQKEMIDTLCELIAIPTINPPGKSYQECIDLISMTLKTWGIQHHIVSHKVNTEYPRLSILGEYGQGEEELHFHGHYDVVPSDSPTQFHPLIQDNRIYGRGSSDMKSGLTVMLYAIRAIKDCGLNLNGKITFSIVPDEETGSRWGTDYLFKTKYLPKSSTGMLMPEPTSGVIWNASKGAFTCRVTVMGKASHVALEHRGINAFERMVGMVQDLLQLKKQVRERKTSLKIQPSDVRRSAMLIGGQSGSGFNFNVVPERAYFTIDRRFNPEEKVDDVKKELQEIFEKHRQRGVEMNVEILQEGDSSMSPPESRLSSALQQSIHEVTGESPVFELCPGVCETRFFHKTGIPGYGYGPGLLEVAHSSEEYVTVDHLMDHTKIYGLTAKRVLAS